MSPSSLSHGQHWSESVNLWTGGVDHIRGQTVAPNTDLLTCEASTVQYVLSEHWLQVVLHMYTPTSTATVAHYSVFVCKSE